MEGKAVGENSDINKEKGKWQAQEGSFQRCQPQGRPAEKSGNKDGRAAKGVKCADLTVFLLQSQDPDAESVNL